MQIREIIKEKCGRESALWAQLQDEGFAGRTYEALAMELARYGTSVLLSFLHGGHIHAALRNVGRSVPGLTQALRDMTRDEVEELVGLTIAHALRLFRRNALAGYGWQPGGNTTVATYFVNTCTLCFSNAFREMAGHGRPKEETPVDSIPDEAGVTTIDIADRPGTLREAMDEKGIRGVLASIAEWTVEGYTQDEIAKELGTTPRAVEGKLRRLRDNLRRRGIRDQRGTMTAGHSPNVTGRRPRKFGRSTPPATVAACAVAAALGREDDARYIAYLTALGLVTSPRPRDQDVGVADMVGFAADPLYEVEARATLREFLDAAARPRSPAWWPTRGRRFTKRAVRAARETLRRIEKDVAPAVTAAPAGCSWPHARPSSSA
ncbi:hypothetical protein [Phytohabitans houttuyneae]|nr:hypothetical protein [Phytohabitans houttuyneae]